MPPKRAHDLVDDIFVALANVRVSDSGPPIGADQARQIIEQLVVNGRIALSENNPQRPAVERLRNRHVLQRSGQEGTTRAYVATSAYLTALTRLRGDEDP